MINHARTLLANADGNGWDAVHPGNEYMSPTYRSTPLPTTLQNVRRQLFGSSPDRPFLNYRLHQYLTVLHASPLVEYVTALDPRITYDGKRDVFLDANLFKPQVVTSGTGRLTTYGTPLPPDVLGQMYYCFRTDILGGSRARLTTLLPPFGSVDIDLVYQNNLSSAIELGGSGYSARVNTTAVGEAWVVSVYNRPQWDLGQIVASLDGLSETTWQALFGAAPQEPYLSWWNLWQRHRELPLRLGALLLALIYRTEERRTSGE